MFAVYRALHCPPVAAMALAPRCRAFLKYGELKTWIATLMADGPPVGLAKGSWVASTKRLVATHQAARRLVLVVGPRGQKCQRLELLEDAVHRVLAAEWAALEAANKAAAARAYMEGLFVDTSLSRLGFSWIPIAGSSMVDLLRARVGAFVTDVRASHFADSDVDGVCRSRGVGSVGRERRSPSRTSSFGVPGGNLCVVGCSIHSSGLQGWRCSTHMFLSYVRRQLTSGWRRSCSVEQCLWFA
jgi:hypothetical protein